MSRIEMAMEKAARLREGVLEPVGEAVPGRPAPRAVAPVPPAVPAERTLAPKNPFLVNLLDPHAPAAEEYRKLKSALVKMTEGEEFRNVVMVTSSVPNEGKSLTALNLAISLAQGLDHTVLLVDADLRRPSLHRYLELEEGPGLSDVLTGEAKLGEAIVATGLGKLSVIRAGSPVDNPVELFSSQRMKGVLDELKHRYPDRYLIVDTPPVLPFAESRSLAHLADAVLFVVRERLASQAEIKEALESIKGRRLLGMVYNAAVEVAGSERYGYYHKYRKGS